MHLPERTRRAFLRVACALPVVGLAGCAGPGGGEGTTDTTTATTTEPAQTTAEPTGTTSGDGGGEEELPPGVSQDEFDHGPVPEAYRTAVSQGGERRDPASLISKETVKFQEATDAVAAGLTAAGHRCENCAEYIPDKNGDGFGACAKVEGYIGTEDWCALWESVDGSQGDGG